VINAIPNVTTTATASRRMMYPVIRAARLAQSVSRASVRWRLRSVRECGY
jgi:hypothetical protein